MAELPEDVDDFVDASAPPTVAASDNDATPKTSSQPSSQQSSSSATKKPSPPQQQKQPTTKNAFTELMKPKPKIQHPPKDLSHKLSQPKHRWRGALLEYVNHPDKFPGQVLRVTEHAVLIKDSYPKATVHLLLLPRSPAHHLLHPHEAFSDPEFLSIIKGEAASAARLAAVELSRLIGSFSASNKARNDAMNSLGSSTAAVPYEEELPPGRDYLKEIKVGVHAHPSMAHLHVHILSRDMRSDALKHRKHYQSFNTEFFVGLDSYPLAEDDGRRDVRFQNSNLNERGMTCWRCGRDFGNRFKELKGHLEEEFEKWKKE